MRLNAIKIIELIVELIEKGSTYSVALAEISVKRQLCAARTFDRHWQAAVKQHTDKQAEIKKEITAQDKKMALAVRKTAVLSSQKRQEILSKMALGILRLPKYYVVGGKLVKRLVEPDHTDVKGAIAELNKMQGDYMPKKIATTDTAGNDIEQPLSSSDIDKILQFARAKK